MNDPGDPDAGSRHQAEARGVKGMHLDGMDVELAMHLNDMPLHPLFADREMVYPAAACFTAILGAGFDVKSRRIPNFLTGPAVLAGLMLHFSLDGWKGLGYSLAAGLICGFIFVVFFLAGGMGAGDVKLMVAAGCLGGLANLSSVLVLTALAGGVMAIGFALLRGQLKQTLFNVGALAAHHKAEGLRPHPELNLLNQKTLRLPYGLAIAAGCTVTLLLQGVQR